MVSSLNAKREQAAPDADGVANDVNPRPAPLASRSQQEGPWRQGDLAAIFDAPTDRDALLYSVLRLLERVVPRRAILVVGRDQLRAFDGEGFSLAPGKASSFSLSLQEDSLLARAVRGEGPVVGSPAELSLTPWYTFTGQAQPSGICLAPIAIQGRTALLILADPGAQPLDHGVVPWIAILARRTSAALATLIATQKRQRADVATGALPIATPTSPQNDAAPPATNDNPLQPLATDDNPLPPTSNTEPDTGEPFTDAPSQDLVAAAVVPDQAADSDEVEVDSHESVWSAHDHPTVEVQVCQTGAYSEVEATPTFASEVSADPVAADSPSDSIAVESLADPVDAELPFDVPSDPFADDPAEFAPSDFEHTQITRVEPRSVDIAGDSLDWVDVDMQSTMQGGAPPALVPPQHEPAEPANDSVLTIATPPRPRKYITEFPLVVDESSRLPTPEGAGAVLVPTLLNARITLVPAGRQDVLHSAIRRTKPGDDPFSDSGLDALEKSDPGAPISGIPSLDLPPSTQVGVSTASHLPFAGHPANDSGAQIWTASQIGLESLSAAPDALPPTSPQSSASVDLSAVPAAADGLDIHPQGTAQVRRGRAFADTMDSAESSSIPSRTVSLSPLNSGQTEPLVDLETHHASGTLVAAGGRLDAFVDAVSPTQPIDSQLVRPRILDPVNHASVPAQSATLLQPTSQRTMHAPPPESAPPPVDDHRMSRAPFPGESRDSSAQQTPMHLMAASELPAAAGGLLAGDPLLRAHVSRLPDAQVMELLNSGAAAYREVALAVLVERGASAQASLLASFPRPLSGPRRELVASGQALEEHGPVIWLLTQQLRDVVDSLREFLTHPDADHRYYATVLLLRANDQASLGRVAELLYDPDEQVRSAAMRYVETWRQNSAVESVLAVVRRHFSDGDPRNVAISVVAAAELRDVAAIPTLIEFLDHASDHVRRRAQTSLVRLTFQELGNDRRTWDKWYKKFSGAGRDRWLLEAMVDRDIRVRENAAREIRSIPRLVVNYNPEFDLRGQQTAQRTVEHFLSLRRGHF